MVGAERDDRVEGVSGWVKYAMRGGGSSYAVDVSMGVCSDVRCAVVERAPDCDLEEVKRFIWKSGVGSRFLEGSWEEFRRFARRRLFLWFNCETDESFEWMFFAVFVFLLSSVVELISVDGWELFVPTPFSR